MKYKNLKAFAHNFTRSFLSYTNYVDDGFVIDDIWKIAKARYEGPLIIYWIPDELPSAPLLTKRMEKAIENYKKWLPEHADRHSIQVVAIRRFYLEIYRLPFHELRFDSVLVDDRGKEHRQTINLD